MFSEIRKDYIQEKYVIIAPRRGSRPHDVVRPERASPRLSNSCVFDPEAKDHPAGVFEISLPKQKKWQIKVVSNKYPAVSLDNPKAYGVQEVVIETPDHLLELEDLPNGHIAKLLEVYALRTQAILKNPKIEYIIIFKNEGGKAGASLVHSHSQIFATDFIPPHLMDKAQQVQRYKLKHGSCVYCDIIKKESKGPRLVFKNHHVIAFCPYASMHNYEVWIMPLRHLDNIVGLNAKERLEWAKILKMVLKKITALNLPYNYYFHDVINDDEQHFYMKITPRGSVWAGVEIGSGIIINPIAPEEAAKYFRERA